MIVLLVALVALALFLFKKIFLEPFEFVSSTLIKIFGLFLNILIVLEILETVTAYLRKNLLQVKLVIVTSLIAVVRVKLSFLILKRHQESI